MVTKLRFFEESILVFDFWTFIFVQNRKPKTLLPTKKPRFLYILFLNLLKEIYQLKLLLRPF
jgi:hypothetical protein